MQLAQFTGIGLVVIGGLLAFMLRSERGGPANAFAQTLAGVIVGLLGALAILIWTADLIPDDVEWIGTVVVVIAAAILVITLRIRTSE